MSQDYMSGAVQAPQQQERINKKAVSFTGRISKDIVLNQTQNGNVVTNISIAIDQANGETQWAQATFWGIDAQVASDFLEKGSTLNGTGLMYNRTFQRQDGTQGSQLQIDSCQLLLNASSIISLVSGMIDKRLAAPTPEPVANGVVSTPVDPIPAPVAQPVAAPTPALDITSDDLPF